VSPARSALTRRSLVLTVAAAAAIAATSCRSTRVLMPPRVDLAPHVRIGLVTFTVDGAKGELAQLATQRFAEAMLAAQPGLEILELGVIAGPADPAAARTLGAAQGVRTVVLGHLVVSDVKPKVSLIRRTASAEMNVELRARLLSAESGSTLWTQSSRRRATLAALDWDGVVPVFSATDPDEAYGEMINALVYDLTYDFRSTWVKQ
jgi:hypothetical protein